MLASDPLLRALALLRPRLPRLALAILCGVLSLGSALALAGVSAWLITRASQMPPVLDLSVAVVAVRAFGISRGVLHYCERLASHDTALRAGTTARGEIYARLAHAETGPAARLPGGDLVGRLGSDVDELADVLVRAVLPIAVAVILGAAAVTVVAMISPIAALVLAGALVVAGGLAPWLSAQGAAAQEEVARAAHSGRDVAAMLALQHAAELRISGRLPAVVAEAAERQRNWARALDRAAAPAALGPAAATAAIGVSVLGAVVAGIGLSATLAPTTVAVLMLLPLSAFEATTALPGAAMSAVRGRIAARRLLELTETAAPRPTPAVAELPADTALRADCVRIRAGRAADGLEISVELPPGGRLAVTGPSGAGKTTLLMTLAGLLAPAHGTVRVGGAPVASLSEPRLRGAVTFFAEDAHVFATTVRDNLLVARGDCTDAEITEALTAVGLSRWLSGLPEGLGTVLTGGADALSAGQRRRLLLARALLCRAAVLLLDEPTEHLDADDAEAILRALLTPGALFAPERSVVVATHHLPQEICCPRLQIALAGYPGCRSSTTGLTGVPSHD